jgi:hypothetical protein
VAVTSDAVIVRPHFPFSLLFLPEVFDLEHTIAIARVWSVNPKARLFGQVVEVSLSLDSGQHRAIELRLRRAQDFVQTLNSKIAELRPSTRRANARG